MQLVAQQTTNAVEEEKLIKSKVNESQVAIHKVVADTYTNFGNFTYSLNPNGDGVDLVTREDVTLVGDHVSLSDTQQDIAIEQGKGYTYNAWGNALTGSASVLGTALASGDFDFGPDSGGIKLFEAVVNCAENLRQASSSTDTAIPTSNIIVPPAT